MTPQPTEMQPMAGVTIRRLTDADAVAVERLAQLDSARAPRGALLGAEIEGRLVAIAPLDGGRTIADPFGRTGELRALLELRAVQLRRRDGGGRRLGLFRRRARAALPSSPPGAGGRLLSLPSRPY